jgi:Uma2 family endonuclease
MAFSILFEERVEIPAGLRSLADFRRWALSEEFPQSGRIDFLAGKIEVDMSPEDVFFHGTVKTEIVGALRQVVKGGDLGWLFTGSTRVSCPQANLSVEPDVVFVSHDAIGQGRVRLVPKSGGEPDRFVELEGPPDLIVEIVSDESVTKDTQRLPRAYFAAGVAEFWLVDARRDPLVFRIHRRGATAYEPAPCDADGYQASLVFGRCYRLDRSRNRHGRLVFDLRDKELSA